MHRPGRLAILARSMVVCPRLVAREGSFARVLASAVALAIAAPPAAAMPPSSDPERQKVEAVFEADGLPRHPLERMGFSSVGCMPCTTPGAER